MRSSKIGSLFNENTYESHGGVVTFMRVLLAILVVLIFWTALAITMQTSERHQVHIEIRKLELEMKDLNTEKQRLMIEQQTFSATPQVASRAVGELGMFFPTDQHRRVLKTSGDPSVSSEQSTKGE